MDALQKFWYTFYFYLGSIIIIGVYSIIFKIPQKKIIKISMIPSIVWAFVIFNWVIGLSLKWGMILGLISSVLIWFLTPSYVDVIRVAGETTGEVLTKNSDEKKSK